MQERRNNFIQIRVTTYEKNKIRGLAKLYAAGDMSLWIRYAAMNVERRHLVYSEYEIKKAAKVKTQAALRKCKTR